MILYKINKVLYNVPDWVPDIVNVFLSLSLVPLVFVLDWRLKVPPPPCIIAGLYTLYIK